MKPLVPVFLALGGTCVFIVVALAFWNRAPVEGYDDDPPLGIG